MARGPVADDAVRNVLLRVASIFDLPQFVKEAEVEDFQGLQLEAYAGAGDYPVHTKVAAWLSAARFLAEDEKTASLTRRYIGARLCEACTRHGIDFEAMAKQAEAALHPTVTPDYALAETWNGRQIQLYPLSDGESVKRAAQHLYDNRGRLPLAWRCKIARALLDKAEEQKVDELPCRDYLQRAAGEGFGDPKVAAVHVLLRAKLLERRESKIAAGLTTYAGELQEAPGSSGELEKCAQLLGAVDETFGLAKHYAAGMPTPEEATCQKTMDEAQRVIASTVKLANGAFMTDEQLRETDLVKVAELLGPAFLERVGIVPSLMEFKQAAAALGPAAAEALTALLPTGKDPVADWNFLSD